MSLFLSYHPWAGGTMGRRQVLDITSRLHDQWGGQGFACQGYFGTLGDGEGWMVVAAPSREALVELFHHHGIPYLCVTEVWHLGSRELAQRIEEPGECLAA